MWLASPALPVGGFTYSEGLEAAVDAGLRGRRSQAARLAARPAAPEPGARRPGRARAGHRRLARATTCRASTQLNDWVLQTRESSRAARSRPSRWAARWSSGCAIDATPDAAAARTLAALQAAPTWPIAFALAAAQHRGAAARRPAGLRLRLGREHGAGRDQGGAARPERGPAHPGAAGRARSRPPSTTRIELARRRRARPSRPMLAILSAQHETQYSRLFRS